MLKWRCPWFLLLDEDLEYNKLECTYGKYDNILSPPSLCLSLTEELSNESGRATRGRRKVDRHYSSLLAKDRQQDTRPPKIQGSLTNCKETAHTKCCVPDPYGGYSFNKVKARYAILGDVRRENNSQHLSIILLSYLKIILERPLTASPPAREW